MSESTKTQLISRIRSVRTNIESVPTHWLILAVPILLLIGFFLIPLLTMVRLSFLTSNPPAPYTLQNYVQIFSQTVYLNVILDTVEISIITTLIVIILGYPFAYSIVFWSRRTTALLLFLILPYWVNYIVRMYAWINILQDRGVINYFEVLLGLTNTPSGHLYNFSSVLIGLIYVWLPLATLAFYASIEGLDKSHIEASKDLGAGPISTFTNVTLPLTKSGLIAGIVLVFIPTFGSFVTPAMLGGTNVLMIGQVIEMQFNQTFDWPFGAALGTVIVALVLLSLLVAGRFGASVAGSRGGDSEGDSA